MGWLLGLIGFFAGAFLGGVVFRHDLGWLAALIGALIGTLFGRLVSLQQRLTTLEKSVDDLYQEHATAQALQREREGVPAAVARRSPEASPARPVAEPAPPPAAAVPEPAPTPAVTVPPPPAQAPIDIEAFGLEQIAEPPPVTPPGRAVFDLGADIPPAAPPRPAARPSVAAGAARRVVVENRGPDPIERTVNAVKRWFTEGNVPVKIGVLVLFLGVGALMKYAADQGWLTVPIEVRLAGIAAVAIAGLLFGWKKRESHRAFALSVQGGAIGMLVLVVFGAYKLYGLIPPTAAFVLLVLLVASAGVLAVLQDAIALAVLGLVGGFLAPILTSSDSGNHVALFTYYAVLNAAIFGIAWFKPWRVLNLLGFAFTFAIGTAWGTLKYRPEMLGSTEPFLILFYAFYLIIPVLYALRQPEERRGFVDGSLVIGTPLLGFPLQVALLDGDRQLLALSALVLGFVHIGVALFSYRRLRLTLLGQTHALLALGFATLAVPLALSARSTACAWAVEGVALVWLGLRQDRRLPRFIGYGLQLAAAVSVIVSGLGGSVAEGELAIFNGEFLALALIFAAALTTYRLLAAVEGEQAGARLFFAWAGLWWVVLGANEIGRFAIPDMRPNWVLAFLGLSVTLAAELRRRLAWQECTWPAIAGVLVAPLLIAPTHHVNHGPLGGVGLAAWLGWFVVSLRAQVNFETIRAPARPLIHFVHTATWVVLLAVEAAYLTHTRFQLQPLWQVLAALLPVAVAFIAVLTRFTPVRYPFGEAAEDVRLPLAGSLLVVLAMAWLAGLLAEGAPTPLTYIPVVNPLELSQIALVLFLLVWSRRHADDVPAFDPQSRAQIAAVLGFILLTSITLRCVHFIGGVPWTAEMARSALAQASLSVVWCLAGFTAMVTGARRRSRPLWMGGAGLVGLVIAKLLVIDRSHLSDLSAIVGVLAVGSLLMIVGWFAPNPPRMTPEGGEQ
ncbi:DUF2339 domain-containing protein [Tahibacter amnicola]|uniref:DUF2339 domain-containing protein n=1 Tax=Tahibacter amnicola TaxID=2976241 RepID=A0ABY6BIU6_9GAMM|nr:DUF2339 domain-containing protein [Tahibacter amnicola]UXI69020.1 DUF2339 domain-containing protein [Tahibacter amnicola]